MTLTFNVVRFVKVNVFDETLNEKTDLAKPANVHGKFINIYTMLDTAI